jgi:hypothetical protein
MYRGLITTTIGLLLVACSSASQNNAVTYQTYSYSCCAEITGTNTWHPGQAVVLHWRTEPGGTTTQTASVPVLLSVRLTGPFPTVDALKASIGTSVKPLGVKTVEAVPVSATDRSGGAPTSELVLPSALPSGFYNLESAESSAGNASSGNSIIIVQP